MSHQSNQMLGSMSSSGSYGSGNSGMPGMNHGSNQMLVSTSSGRYGSGSAQRNMHQSTGTGSQRSMNMRSSSLSSGSQPVPEIGYLEEEISEADNSNTVFIQITEALVTTECKIREALVVTECRIREALVVMECRIKETLVVLECRIMEVLVALER